MVSKIDTKNTHLGKLRAHADTGESAARRMLPLAVPSTQS